MSELSEKCVPRILTPEKKLKRGNISWTLLIRFQAKLKNFCETSPISVMNLSDVAERSIRLEAKSTKRFQKQALHGC